MTIILIWFISGLSIYSIKIFWNILINREILSFMAICFLFVGSKRHDLSERKSVYAVKGILLIFWQFNLGYSFIQIYEIIVVGGYEL